MDANEFHLMSLDDFSHVQKVMNISPLLSHNDQRPIDVVDLRTSSLPTDLLYWTLADGARSAEGTLASLVRQQFH